MVHRPAAGQALTGLTAISAFTSCLGRSAVEDKEPLGCRHRAGSSREQTMAKAYWVVCYRSISDPAARDAYTKLAVPAVLASGGRFLARGLPAKTYEGGIDQRTVLVEFDSLAQAICS
jgi:uncharacterized protein (DUF1330 family)